MNVCVLSQIIYYKFLLILSLWLFLAAGVFPGAFAGLIDWDTHLEWASCRRWASAWGVHRLLRSPLPPRLLLPLLHRNHHHRRRSPRR